MRSAQKLCNHRAFAAILLRIESLPEASIVLKLITFILLAILTGPLQAYVGPGAGISVLGSLLGILATIFVAIGAILFWPIRKMMKRKKAQTAPETAEDKLTGP